MEEAFVQLTCPSCQKNWESQPSKLPRPGESFTCPDCGERRSTAEFARTDTDVDTLRQLA